jgi:lipoate synthase
MYRMYCSEADLIFHTYSLMTIDPLEPEHVAQAIAEWGLDYVVLTR